MALMEFFRKRRHIRPPGYPQHVSELPPEVQTWIVERSTARTAEERDAAAAEALIGHEDELRRAIADADAMKEQRRRERHRG